jgi:hypothetical protein
MSDTATIEKARAVVGQLMDSLCIHRIICVDDVYARRWTLDDVQAAQQELTPEEIQQLMPELRAATLDERDVRRAMFQRVWNELDDPTREERTKRILTAARTKRADGQDDSADALFLQEIIPEGRLRTISPSEWAAEEPRVIAGADQERVLVLFDQDLSDDGGSPTGGMALVQNLLGKSATENLLCGLLTHTVTISNQHDRWEQLARDSGISRDRFLLVAKGWLSKDPLGFARMLKLLALSPDCAKLKARVKALFGTAADEAARQVEDISVFDFDHIVFGTSAREGIWEPDTLFRLHGMFHRAALREMAHGDTELRGVVDRLRKVSHLPTNSDAAPIASSWKIQQMEMYEPGDYINKMHLPLDVGDIFQKTDGSSSKAFVLVGQPCDLMVRSDGKRHPEVADVVLAEIFPSQNEKRHCVPLPYFGDNPATTHYVRLRLVHVVHPCVLDMCVFNTDGQAKMDLSMLCPTGLTQAWQARFRFVQEHARRVLQTYETFGQGKANDSVMEEAFRQEAVRIFPPHVSNRGLFKARIDLRQGVQCISVNCKRIMRLCRPRAVALAVNYAAYSSRPAFEHDVGR